MKNVKTYIIGFIVLCVFAFGFFLAKNIYDVDIKIKYGQPVITKQIKYVPSITTFEIAIHKVDVLKAYLDKGEKHQVYTDTLRIMKDSTNLRVITSVDVNVDTKKALFSYSGLEIKGYDKEITITKVIPKWLTEYKPIPFYQDHWFYTTLGLLASLILIFIGI